VNKDRYEHLCDRLNAAASDDVIDPELFLDAEIAIRGLLIEQFNKESIISNQRAEIQRLQSIGASY
jgi:hypothetical protein